MRTLPRAGVPGCPQETACKNKKHLSLNRHAHNALSCKGWFQTVAKPALKFGHTIMEILNHYHAVSFEIDCFHGF
jgi:hypothetical protein